MPKVVVYNIAGEQVGEIQLDEGIFGVEVNEDLLHQAVVMYQARKRRGTAATKTRGLVAGGGRKPWRQKGTGRARHGSIRSPLWVGGGTVFGPQPRDYKYSMPKKARRQALRSALSAKVNTGSLIVVDELKLDQPKTKTMYGILQNLNASGSTLLVTAGPDDNVRLSARNIAKVKVLPANELNALEVLSYRRLLLTQDAVAKVEEVLA
ncbi:MAG: 50S ribosomal protein L4 [Limnochordia bacterium]|nr:50S ribosomal protein L4 [Bacillota bacterium]